MKNLKFNVTIEHLSNEVCKSLDTKTKEFQPDGEPVQLGDDRYRIDIIEYDLETEESFNHQLESRQIDYDKFEVDLELSY